MKAPKRVYIENIPQQDIDKAIQQLSYAAHKAAFSGDSLNKLKKGFEALRLVGSKIGD